MNNNNASNPTIQELGHSPDALTQRKAELMALLAQAAPELISDQQLNVAKLQELLGEERLAADEHYELSWAGKTAARREIQKTSSHTLRPDAKNPAQAQHMLIEGENLEVLRVLQKSYYGKVKMIYIDPPYNTGSDSFVYPDNYSETLDEYKRRTGEKNEAGYLNKQSLWKKNSKESGQYHSAWLSMMYPRLYLARNLLRDDGVIFISIDDNEAANLKVLCDEIFGSENFVGNIAWESKTKSQNTKTSYNKLQPKVEYAWLYKKNSCNRFHLKVIGEKQYELQDEKGSYRLQKIEQMDAEGVRGRETMVFPILGVLPPPGKQWKVGRDFVDDFEKRGDLLLLDESPTVKMREEDERTDVTEPFWGLCSKEIGTAESAKKELTETLEKKHGFDTVKPVELIKKFIFHATNKDSIVLDFFAGSGTTAHAVMDLNLEDGGNRQCISVQMPEIVDEDSESYKAGFRTIADITRARIDKVIAKIKAEHPDKTTDLACAHFTLAPSNFKVWQGDMNNSEALREQLSMFQSAEKGGQSKPADAQTAMLTELLLKHGLGALGVHAIAKPRQIAGVNIHRVLMADDKTMWLCFETYTDALKDEIVKAMPAQVVMLNTGFVGVKADEQLANLQLELVGLDIGLTVI
jgi:adenine-specific DNA-methyltransferase